MRIIVNQSLESEYYLKLHFKQNAKPLQEGDKENTYINLEIIVTWGEKVEK